eukprot:CCRYP_021140-RA/>CCRYP_021140-RA protein AED:0.49 eAED:1.00 QI:0/-1/0/1/-1/0/1/0/28
MLQRPPTKKQRTQPLQNNCRRRQNKLPP